MLAAGVKPHVKLATIDRIMDIYGLAAPKGHKIDGNLSAEGRPAVVVTEIVVTTREEAKAILAMQAKEEAARLAGPSGGGSVNGRPAIS
jgi:hypothetical protein